MSDGDRCEQLVTVRYPKATLRCLLPEGHKEIHSFDVQRPASLAQLAPIREAWLNEGPVPKYHRDWHRMMIPEAAVHAAAKVLLDEGGGPGNSIHSWRCEHPDRYGPCDCVTEAARAMLEAAAPLLAKGPSA